MARPPVLPSISPLSRRVLGVVLVVVVVANLFVVPVSAAEDPRFETTVPEPELQPGTQQTVTVIVTNDAEAVDEQVKPAANLKVTAKSGSTPIEVISGDRRLGRLADGESVAVDFRIEVPANASGGTYHLPLELTYEFDGDERKRTTVPARVEIPERPIFEIASVDVDLHPRETGVVTLSMTNDGSQPARDTRVALASENAALAVGESSSATAFIGTVEPGGTTEATFAVTATQATLARAYDLTVQPTYENTNGITTTAPARPIGVAPATEPRIVISDQSGVVSPGETGTLEMALENAGDSTLSETVFRLEAAGPDLTLDGGQTTTRLLGEWGPGETKSVRTEVGATPAVQGGEYPVQASLVFEHPAGIESVSGPFDVGVPVTAVDVFAYSDVSVTHQGPGAVLSARVTNEGEKPIRDAVVVVDSSTPGVLVSDGSTSVGTLEPGETATVSAEVQISDADRAPQQFSAQVRYEGDSGQAYRSNSSMIWADVATDGDLLTVEPVNATFDIDTTNELRVRIRNDGPAPLEDIRAQLTAQPPYRSQSPTAYVTALDPGESTIVAFEVTTPEDGVQTTDALSMNLTAETSADRTVLDGPHLVPITVDGGTDATGNSTVIAVLAFLIIILLGAGWWWLNR